MKSIPCGKNLVFGNTNLANVEFEFVASYIANSNHGLVLKKNNTLSINRQHYNGPAAITQTTKKVRVDYTQLGMNLKSGEGKYYTCVGEGKLEIKKLPFLNV